VPRITKQQYYARYRFLRNAWMHYRYVYGLLPPGQQWLVHAFYQPSKVLTPEQLLTHCKRIKSERPSLPNTASKATLRLYRTVNHAVARSGDDESRFREIIGRVTLASDSHSRATRGMRLNVIVRPEPDLQRLSGALMAIYQARYCTEGQDGHTSR
jgi:hypothetical protein